MSFFKCHSHFSTMEEGYFGAGNLMTRLTSVLVSRIKDVLPAMRKDLLSAAEATNARLDAMGKELPSGAAEVRAKVVSFAQESSSVVKDAETGNYSDTVFVSQPEARLMALIWHDIKGPDAKFKCAILATEPKDDWRIETLRVQISTMRGRELAGFLNFKVFDLLIKMAVAAWKRHCHELLQETKQLADSVCGKIVKDCPAFGNVHAVPFPRLCVQLGSALGVG